MGILSNLLANGVRASKVDMGHPRDPVLAAWFGANSDTLSGVNVTPDTALKVSAVWLAVRVLSETLAWIPLDVFKRLPQGAREKDPAHPLFDILRWQPNRWQTAYEFKRMLMGHICLRGNGYAEIIGDGQAAVRELVPLHPDRTVPFRAPDGQIAYRHQPEKGPQRILLQGEVFHLRGYSDDGIVGLNPIELHREGVGLAMATERHGAALFGNNAAPKGAIKVPAVLTDPAAKELREGWERRHKGVENRGKIAILDGGMEWMQIGMTSEDAEYIATRGFQAVEIARMFRIQPHKLMILDRATFSNIEQQAIEFVTDTMMPHFENWIQAARRDLLTEASRRTHFLDFNVNALLKGDTLSRFQAYAIGRQWGWVSANDVLRKENENPIGDAGDVYLSPANMTPAQLLDQMIDAKIAAAAAGGTPPRPNGQDETMNGGANA